MTPTLSNFRLSPAHLLYSILCLLGLLLSTAALHGQDVFIVPNVRAETGNIKESSSSFLCPTNTVITGRYHSGDENGNSRFEYASLKAINSQGQAVAGTITVEDVRWEGWFKESSGGGFDALPGRVIVGRQHYGDENANTRYATAIVKLNGQSTYLINHVNSANIRESSWNWFRTTYNQVMIGRHHSGDENGGTYYRSATIAFTPVGNQPPPAGTIIVPNVRWETGNYTESSSYFLGPDNTVITGRTHTGDENGSTRYEYANLKAINPQGQIVPGVITVADVRWENSLSESFGAGYDAPVNRVIVGREHTGDENGSTRYATGVVKFNGFPTKMINYTTTTTRKESGGWNWFRTAYDQVLTGRHHMGDENGNTYYGMGTISCDVAGAPQGRFRVVLLMHPEEVNFPMAPMDFIHLSRFRRHNAGASDDGFNKLTNSFLNNNDHTPEYYDIPVSIINTYYIPGSTYNLRPRDANSFGVGEVFLEPDDNLRGDFNPNGRVPVFEYSSPTTSEKREYWIFYGYNYANYQGVSLSHQGDWERVILDIVNNNIVGATLSQHTKLQYYTRDQLQVTDVNGVQTLYVYPARGSHAHYPQPGNYPLSVVLGIDLGVATDVTANGGYQWTITDHIQNLSTQPWRLYAGGWGEVGTGIWPWNDATTGPLGPWYKRSNFGRIIIGPPLMEFSMDAINNTVNNTAKATLFPNPTTGKFSVAFPKPVDKAWIEVVDVGGRTIQQVVSNGSIVEVNIPYAAPGTYFVRVKQQDGSIVIHKIVKN